MKIRQDSNIVPEPGDFLSRVDDNELLVAPQLAQFAQDHRLATAEALAGYAGAFPSSLAHSLGWAVPAVIRAVELLRSEVTSKSLMGVAPNPVRRVYGFRPGR